MLLANAFSVSLISQDLEHVAIPESKELSGGYFTYKKLLTVDGIVDGNLFCLGGQTIVYGEVKGNVTVVFGGLEVDKDAVISGSIITIGSPFVGEQKDSRIDIPIRDIFYPNTISLLELIKRSVFRILITFSLCCLLIFLIPKFVRKTGLEIRTDWIPSFFAGSFVAVFFGMTLFGSLMIFSHNLGPVLFVFLALVLTISTIFGLAAVFEAGAYYVNKALNFKLGFVHALFIAVILCEIGCLIPMIGPIMQLILFILGLGATLMTRFGTNKGWFTKSRNVWSA